MGRVVDRLDAGDHELFLLEPVAASAGREADFTFHRAKLIEPGSSPMSALPAPSRTAPAWL